MNPWRDHAVPAMRHEALYGDRVVRCFVDRPTSLLAMFEQARATRPAHDAVVCEGRRWSYAETGARSERIAAGLVALGIGAGDRVILFLANRPEFLFVLLAVQRLGAIAVPVGVREQRPGPGLRGEAERREGDRLRRRARRSRPRAAPRRRHCRSACRLPASPRSKPPAGRRPRPSQRSRPTSP